MRNCADGSKLAWTKMFCKSRKLSIFLGGDVTDKKMVPVNVLIKEGGDINLW